MPQDSCPACVLLVEDDEALRETIARFLQSKGYPTLTAENADQAFACLGNVQRPCLVLVDLLTLQIDCGRLLAGLGPHDRIATLPMVLLSVAITDSRPAVVKRSADFDILFRVVQEHCCGGPRDGAKRVDGAGLPSEG